MGILPHHIQEFATHLLQGLLGCCLHLGMGVAQHLTEQFGGDEGEGKVAVKDLIDGDEGGIIGLRSVKG